MITEYDERRNVLREMLKEARQYARQYILDSDICGFDDMKQGYATEVYKTISDAYDAV